MASGYISVWKPPADYQWLGNCTTDRAGWVLKNIAAILGLRQVMREPKSGKNILDLILTNLPAGDTSVHDNIDAMVKKAQHLFFLKRLRKFGISTRTLTNFYRCTIESILSRCLMACYGNCSVQEDKKLQKI
eukprot:g46077.t1